MAPEPESESAADVGVDVPEGYHNAPAREEPVDADVALLLFKALTVITIFAAILCMVMNIVSLVRSFRWRVDVFVGILRIYAVVFAGFVAVAETEWEWLFRQWPYLEYWFGRGMLQIFVAVMTKALSDASWEVRFERLMHEISAWTLLAVGFIYSFAGLICMRQLKRKRIQRRQWRERAVRDLEDLDAKRRDLQGLLAAGS